MTDHRGVVALAIDKSGRVVASVSDFEGGCAAGFTVDSQQRMRARQALANEVMSQLCHPDIAKALYGYHSQNIMENLCREHGWSTHYEVIGGGKDGE